MKLFKFGLLFIVIAIIIDLAIVRAYSSPVYMNINMTLSGNNEQWTGWITKNTWTHQRYYNSNTYTAITNPCPNCQIITKPYDSLNNMYVGVISKTGQTKVFTDSTSVNSPGDYRLKINRFDFTLLTTYHSGSWTVNATSD